MTEQISNPASGSSIHITTVDVWDTLLRRNCHPDEVKLASARYLCLEYHACLKKEFRDQYRIFERRRNAEIAIGERSVSQGKDDEYDLFDVWFDTIAQVTSGETEDSVQRMAVSVAEYEIEFEKFISYPDPGISDWLRNKARSMEYFFLSDFYIGTDHLKELIESKHPGLNIRGGLASCSVGVNKRSGRLYEEFITKYDAVKDKVVHIGDNLHSDYTMARRMGIKAHLYNNKEEQQKIRQLRRQFGTRMGSRDLGMYWKLIRKEAEKYRVLPLGKKARYRNIGVKLSPLFVLYVVFAIEQARKSGVDTVYYFTREGEILKKIHDQILDHNQLESLPKAELLEVSRIATFGATIRDLSLPELNRIWTMYPRQSFRSFIVTLGLDVENYIDIANRHELNIDEEMIHPWKNQKFLDLLEDGDFRSMVLTQLEVKRKGLKQYLIQKGITDETEKIVIVDIGWRGTIQDNLARIYPDAQWTGVYLALFKYLNQQPANVTKVGYLFDDNQAQAQESKIAPQAPIEMLFNSDSGSVTGYSGDDHVVAKKLVSDTENEVYHRLSLYVQQGVLMATNGIWDVVQERALMAGDFSREALNMVERITDNPPRAIALAYFSLDHNETFGNGVFVRNLPRIPYKELIRSRSARQAVDVLRMAAKQSGWPKGFLKVHRVNGLYRVARRGRRSLGTMRHYVGSLLLVLRRLRGKVRKISSVGKIQPLLDKIQNIDLGDETRVDFNKRHVSTRERNGDDLVFHWLIPDVGHGSGGHMTILRFATYFQSLGITNRVFVMDRSAHASDRRLKEFIEEHITPLDGVEVYASSKDMPHSDVLFSTFWLTGYENFKRDNTCLKVYFIQDYEPYFYAMSSNWLLAERTYRMGYYGIAASKWLYGKMKRYNMDGCYFDLGYDPAVYYPDPLVERDPDKLLVYARPLTERRGTELLVACLAMIKELRPRTKITIFGADSFGYMDIPFEAEYLGLLNEDQLRRHHSEAAITLLTSLTNYSLIPIEAMACGAVVIDVDVESTRATFAEDAPIILADPMPYDMAKRVVATLDDADLCHALSRDGLEYVRKYTWDDAFLSVENSLFKEYFGAQYSDVFSEGNLVRARAGSRVFLISGGKRYCVENPEQLRALNRDMSEVEEVDVKDLVAMPAAGSVGKLVTGLS